MLARLEIPEGRQIAGGLSCGALEGEAPKWVHHQSPIDCCVAVVKRLAAKGAAELAFDSGWSFQ